MPTMNNPSPMPISHHEACGVCHVSGPCPHSLAAFMAEFEASSARHTCINTCTTLTGQPVVQPCLACASALGTFVSPVVVRSLRELHPTRCGCLRCWPWAQSSTTGGNLPQQALWMSLADGEAPPEGWRYPGVGII